MAVFVDTSALYALLDADDAGHHEAAERWRHGMSGGETFVCHNYILVETSALVQRHLGMEAVKDFEESIVPVLRVVWIDREIHEAALAALLAVGKRTLSLVDCVSLEVMRRAGIRTALSLDPHLC
ncbi:MAG: PIN domain-containing protein [Candidatus Aminicenantes bacterium]|nr:PIN domain-containing protein [Candidatus Aminicenantes bacterium]